MDKKKRGAGRVTYFQMACHTWALSGNENSARDLHIRYQDLSNELGKAYGYGSQLGGKTLKDVRQEVMNALVDQLCDKRTAKINNVVYVCGGFRDGQVCPEHMWLEDHTAKKSYDTFIDTKIIVVDGVGQINQPFQPGCESDPFYGNEIARVKVNGFTTGQIKSIG